MGLSIGTTNLVAARVGNPPVMRRSVLSISGEPVSGFVERVGDPIPVVAADGSSHLADELVVEAIAAMVGNEPTPQVAVAVPAHWTGATLRALRTAMRNKPNLAPNGAVPRLVSDAVAALTALHVNPGLPGQGVIALLDFGGGGTSITLADAAANFEPVDTVRYADFSGDGLDQVLLAKVLDGIADAGEVDPAGTQAVGSLSQLREDCRQAKEALSEDTTTEVGVELPGYSSKVSVTRPEFEALVDAGLAGVLSELDDMLLRNRIQWADVTTVAMVGGGARIPLIAARVSEHTKTPLVVSPVPALDAAVGAAIVAAYTLDAEAATGVAPADLIPTGEFDAAAPDSATFRALAWSQAEEFDDDDSLLFTDETAYGYDTGTTRAVAQYVPAVDSADVDEHRSWQRLPQLVFGIAVAAALLAVGGVAIVLTTATDNSPPTPSPVPVIAPSVRSSTVEPPPPPPPPPEPLSTVTVTEAPPPPPPPPVEVTTTHTTVAPTHTTTSTTTTTPPTTTTTTETTTTTTTTETTTPSPTMTTSYITVPFVPVPIPIQVPVTPTPQQQYPQQYPNQYPNQYPQQYPYQQQPQYPY
jgi:actin-like ATPase involved in cell morphogenesis